MFLSPDAMFSKHDVPCVWWWFRPSQLSRTVTMPGMCSCLEAVGTRESHSHHTPSKPQHWSPTWMAGCSVMLKPQLTLVSPPQSDKLLNEVVLVFSFYDFSEKAAANNMPLQNCSPKVNHLSLHFFLHEIQEFSVAQVSTFWLLIIWLKGY